MVGLVCRDFFPNLNDNGKIKTKLGAVGSNNHYKYLRWRVCGVSVGVRPMRCLCVPEFYCLFLWIPGGPPGPWVAPWHHGHMGAGCAPRGWPVTIFTQPVGWHETKMLDKYLRCVYNHVVKTHSFNPRLVCIISSHGTCQCQRWGDFKTC